MIDTLRFARRMASAGLVREHAEAIAEGLADEVRENYPSRGDLDRGLDGVRLELQGLRTELQKEMRELAWKVAALLLAQGAAVVALIRLVP